MPRVGLAVSPMISSCLQTLFFLTVLALFPLRAYAGESPLPSSLQGAKTLIQQVDGPAFQSLFEKTLLKISSSPLAPLARYQPEGKIIEFGANTKRYQDEYVYITSIMERADRPNFEQYLTVLVALSIANEKAHFEQDIGGSLDDFFIYQKQQDLRRMCALYALQQHVSDVVMLEMAVKLERYFLGLGSPQGVRAVRAALDKMGLKETYEDFRQGLLTGDSNRFQSALEAMRKDRSALNISNISSCKNGGAVSLPSDVIRRATAPTHLGEPAPASPSISEMPRSYNE
jgi:hypothetical protein